MDSVLKLNCNTSSASYQVVFEWEFKNYSKVPTDWTKKSQDFSVEPDSSWYVKYRKLTNDICLYLCRNKGKNIEVNCETSILNCKKSVLYKDNCTYENSGEVDILPGVSYSNVLRNLPEDKVTFKISFTVKDIGTSTVANCGYGNSNEIDLLPASYTYRNVLQNLPEDKATYKIYINVKDMRPSTVNGNLHRTTETSLNSLKTLSRDLKTLLANSIKTDVTINIGGETLSAHKNILMARSEVFEKMFQKGMAEEEDSVVNIEDIGVNTMKIVLSFMYSAQLDECDSETALEVYRAADKYAVSDLRDACVCVLTSKLTMENVCKLLFFADMHCHQEMKDKAMQFIALHYNPKQTELDEKS